MFRGDSVLLIDKLRGHGRGKVNAPGGKFEPGESARDCAFRELHEEVGLHAHSLIHRATLRFLDTGNGFSLEGHVYVTDEVRGTPVRTAEAIPFWCPRDQIPYEKMWEDDRYWLPHVLEGSSVVADFIFWNDRLREWYLERSTVEVRD